MSPVLKVHDKPVTKWEQTRIMLHPELQEPIKDPVDDIDAIFKEAPTEKPFDEFMNASTEEIIKEQEQTMNETSVSSDIQTTQSQKQTALAMLEMYQNTENIGTEEMTPEDVNTPNLKIVQSTTENIENKKEGYFYRSDTQEQIEMPLVDLVYVTTKQTENYNKDGWETVKVYYGYYHGTKEPFKLFVRGYSLQGHREFQTVLLSLKNRLHVPMFGLKVQLSTERKTIALKDKFGKPNGKTKDIYVLHMTPLRDGGTGMPIIESDPERIAFLFESANRFKMVSKSAVETEIGESEHDTQMNDNG